MRARSPCCMPRSKRRTATLGDGYACFSVNSIRTAHPTCTHNFDVDFNFAHRKPRNENEDCHAENKPEVLLRGYVPSTKVPRLGLDIIRIAKDGENPCFTFKTDSPKPKLRLTSEEKTKPSNEAMVTLENTNR